MTKKNILLVLCAIVISTCFVECKKKNKEEDTTPDSSFDKAGMLYNIGKNIILPAYSNLKSSIDSLRYLNNLFISTPSLTNLANLQNQFTQAYFNYQSISIFEFGPADAEIIRANFNIFPCDTTQINSKITAADFNIGTVADLDAKGFPAIDFLLYGANQNNNQVLARYTTGVDTTNARTYLVTLINELKTKCDIVNAAWSASGGNYVSTFKNNTGSDVGGSIGMLVNQLNYDLEILKNSEIGIPLGKKTLGTPLPEKTEGVYCTKSLMFAMQQLKSIENIYLGRDKNNVDGLGFDDYVSSTGTTHPLGPLNDVIKNKFIAAKTKLGLITGTLSQAVVSSPTVVDAAYIELQQLLVLLKVDMTSALGVMITYQDNDGD